MLKPELFSPQQPVENDTMEIEEWRQVLLGLWKGVKIVGVICIGILVALFWGFWKMLAMGFEDGY